MRSEPRTIHGGKRRTLLFGTAAAVLLGVAVAIAVPGGWQGVASTIRDMAYGPGPGQKPVATTTSATFPKAAKTGKAFLVVVKISATGAAAKGFCRVETVSGAFARQAGTGAVRGGRCTMKVTVGRPGKVRLRVAFTATNAAGSKTFLRNSKSKVATVNVTGAANLKLALTGFGLALSGDQPTSVTPSGGTITDCSATRGLGGSLFANYTFTGDPAGVLVEASWQTPAGPKSSSSPDTPSPGSNGTTIDTDRTSPNGAYSVTLTLRDAPRGTPVGPPLASAQGQVTVNCPAPAPTE